MIYERNGARIVTTHLNRQTGKNRETKPKHKEEAEEVEDTGTEKSQEFSVVLILILSQARFVQIRFI